MSTDIDTPGPTSQEIELQEMQLNLIRESRAYQNLMKPFILEQMGLRESGDPEALEKRGELQAEIKRVKNEPNYDDYGNNRTGDKNSRIAQLEAELAATPMPTIEKIPESELPEAQRNARQIQGLLQGRQLKALRGELPVDPALERELKDQEAVLREGLARGPGLNSTVAAQKLGQFTQRAGLLRDSVRRGEIQSGGALLANRAGLLGNVGPGAAQPFSAFPGRTLGLLSGINQSFQPYQFSRQLEFGARQANAQTNASLISAGLGAGGFALGSGLGKPPAPTKASA